MNSYKAAWYAQQQVGMQERPPARQQARRESRAQNGVVPRKQQNWAVRQMGQDLALGALHAASRQAAQSQIAGRLGVALRVGGRIGVRAVPILGTALLLYDLYQVYGHISD